MAVFWLSEKDIVFPPVEFAEPDGLLAAGGDLSDERLMAAYRNGIFPWYNPGDPILWWSPDPRLVLFPEELKVSKSMRPYFNQHKFDLSYDQCFSEVIKACSSTFRPEQQGGTWINENMIAAYTRLHESGIAHSVEVWKDGSLVGGLYGIGLGKVFFGESMFTRVSNASKYGFISLVRLLKANGYVLVDCQQETKHLVSMGARNISRKQFLQLVKENIDQGGLPREQWTGK